MLNAVSAASSLISKPGSGQQAPSGESTLDCLLSDDVPDGAQ